jgi:hypothetical protein
LIFFIGHNQNTIPPGNLDLEPAFTILKHCLSSSYFVRWAKDFASQMWNSG